MAFNFGDEMPVLLLHPPMPVLMHTKSQQRGTADGNDSTAPNIHEDASFKGLYNAVGYCQQCQTAAHEVETFL